MLVSLYSKRNALLSYEIHSNIFFKPTSKTVVLYVLYQDFMDELLGVKRPNQENFLTKFLGNLNMDSTVVGDLF